MYDHKKSVFIIYRLNYWRIKIYRKLLDYFHIHINHEPIVYAKRNVLSREQFNEELYNRIVSREPFMVSRFGSNEILNTIEYLCVNYGLKRKMNKKYIDQLNINAGVFPKGEEMVKRFSEYMLSIIPDIDYLGSWFRNMEDYLLIEYAPKAKPVRLKNLEPYCSNNPWSKALEGKKVLVIHPFESTIRSQYNNRKLLFEDPNVLPEFELLTLKAVQSIGNNSNGFSDWFEALDYMYSEAMKHDFDVALIGCGAYGMPLAARIKRAGKQAIHLGGSVQILFGIKGSRWDSDPLTNCYYNEYWVRPMPIDTPNESRLVENGCYW